MTEGSQKQLGNTWILVAVAAVLACANALQNDLVYDAQALVETNATLDEASAQETLGGQLGSLNQLFREGFWDGVNRQLDPSRQILGQALYRPLMLYPIGIIHITMGEVSTPYNILNLLFHVLTSILVLKLGLALTNSRPIATLAGLIFAVHPIHSEAIAYVAGLGETQSAFFALLSIVLYIGAFTDSRIRIGCLALSLLSFLAALFTKESAATVLVLVVLADVARKNAPPVSKRLLAYLLFAAAICLNLYVRYKVLGRLSPDTTFITRLDNPLIYEDFMTRLATGVTLFTQAIQLFLLPIGQSADYSFNQLPIEKSLAGANALIAFMICAFLTIIGFKALKNRPALGFGLLLFLFTFGAVSNILLPIGTIFGERLLYLPSVGLCLAAAFLIHQALNAARKKSDTIRRVGVAITAFVIVTLLIVTWIRNTKYKSIDALYVDMVQTAPDSARAWYQRGELERKKASEGNRAESLSASAFDFRRAVSIMPEFLLARMQLGMVLSEMGEFDQSLSLLRAAEEQVPDVEIWRPVRDDIKRNIAIVLARATSNPDAEKREEAITELLSFMEQHVRDNPNDVGSAAELGVFYLQVGQVAEAKALAEQQRLAHPDSDIIKALLIQIAFKSNDLETGNRLLDEFGESENPGAQMVADLYRGLRHLGEATGIASQDGTEAAAPSFQAALNQFDLYIEKYPEDFQGYYWRGYVLHEGFENRGDETLKDYQQTIRLNPSHPDVFFRISQLLVHMGKHDAQTLSYFNELAKTHPDNGFFMVGYGRVLGQQGMHKEAAKAYNRAVELGFDGANTHALLAKELIDSDQPERALDMIKAAEKKHQFADPELANLKGVCLLELEKYPEALNQFEVGVGIANQDQTGRFLGIIPQLRFQEARTKLRIEGMESQGLRELLELQDMLEAAGAQTEDGLEKANTIGLVPYIYIQRAWARTNIASMIDTETAIKLLETAHRYCEENGLRHQVGDVTEMLIETYEAEGMTDRANELRKTPKTTLPPPDDQE